MIFFFNDTATTEIYTLSLHDALPISPRAPVEEHLAAGDDVLCELDVQGALAIRSAFPEALLIFVTAPSRSEQRARLVSRGQDDLDEMARRIAKAEAEEAQAAEFDAVVVNDDVDRAVAEMADMIKSRRSHDVARSPEPD